MHARARIHVFLTHIARCLQSQIGPLIRPQVQVIVVVGLIIMSVAAPTSTNHLGRGGPQVYVGTYIHVG